MNIASARCAVLLRTRKAFNLLELSVVLVILSMLTTTVLAGNSLITRAQINKIQEEYHRFRASLLMFRDTYGCMPGSCTASRITNLQRIGLSSECLRAVNMTNHNAVDSALRRSCMMHSMMLAGYMNGVDPTYNTKEQLEDSISGKNIPHARFSKRASWDYRLMNASGTYSILPKEIMSDHRKTGHLLLLRGSNYHSTSGNMSYDISAVDAHSKGVVYALSSSLARKLDVKFDDSLPFTGNVRSGRIYDNSPACYGPAVDALPIVIKSAHGSSGTHPYYRSYQADLKRWRSRWRIAERRHRRWHRAEDSCTATSTVCKTSEGMIIARDSALFNMRANTMSEYYLLVHRDVQQTSKFDVRNIEDDNGKKCTSLVYRHESFVLCANPGMNLTQIIGYAAAPQSFVRDSKIVLSPGNEITVRFDDGSSLPRAPIAGLFEKFHMLYRFSDNSVFFLPKIVNGGAIHKAGTLADQDDAATILGAVPDFDYLVSHGAKVQYGVMDMYFYTADATLLLVKVPKYSLIVNNYPEVILDDVGAEFYDGKGVKRSFEIDASLMSKIAKPFFIYHPSGLPNRQKAYYRISSHHLRRCSSECCQAMGIDDFNQKYQVGCSRQRNNDASSYWVRDKATQERFDLYIHDRYIAEWQASNCLVEPSRHITEVGVSGAPSNSNDPVSGHASSTRGDIDAMLITHRSDVVVPNNRNLSANQPATDSVQNIIESTAMDKIYTHFLDGKREYWRTNVHGEEVREVTADVENGAYILYILRHDNGQQDHRLFDLLSQQHVDLVEGSDKQDFLHQSRKGAVQRGYFDRNNAGLPVIKDLNNTVEVELAQLLLRPLDVPIKASLHGDVLRLYDAKNKVTQELGSIDANMRSLAPLLLSQNSRIFAQRRDDVTSVMLENTILKDAMGKALPIDITQWAQDAGCADTGECIAAILSVAIIKPEWVAYAGLEKLSHGKFKFKCAPGQECSMETFTISNGNMVGSDGTRLTGTLAGQTLPPGVYYDTAKEKFVLESTISPTGEMQQLLQGVIKLKPLLDVVDNSTQRSVESLSNVIAASIVPSVATSSTAASLPIPPMDYVLPPRPRPSHARRRSGVGNQPSNSSGSNDQNQISNPDNAGAAVVSSAGQGATPFSGAAVTVMSQGSGQIIPPIVIPIITSADNVNNPADGPQPISSLPGGAQSATLPHANHVSPRIVAGGIGSVIHNRAPIGNNAATSHQRHAPTHTNSTGSRHATPPRPSVITDNQGVNRNHPLIQQSTPSVANNPVPQSASQIHVNMTYRDTRDVNQGCLVGYVIEDY